MMKNLQLLGGSTRTAPALALCYLQHNIWVMKLLGFPKVNVPVHLNIGINSSIKTNIINLIHRFLTAVFFPASIVHSQLVSGTHICS